MRSEIGRISGGGFLGGLLERDGCVTEGRHRQPGRAQAELRALNSSIAIAMSGNDGVR